MAHVQEENEKININKSNRRKCKRFCNVFKLIQFKEVGFFDENFLFI